MLHDQVNHVNRRMHYQNGKSVSTIKSICTFHLLISLQGNLQLSLQYLTSSSDIAETVMQGVSFGQKWKTGTGRQYFTDIIGHCDKIGLQSYQIRWKNAK